MGPKKGGHSDASHNACHSLATPPRWRRRLLRPMEEGECFNAWTARQRKEDFPDLHLISFPL